MKKIPVVFAMDYATDTLLDQVRPGQEWVLAGEGTATVKFDGTAARWHQGKLWKRFDRKLTRQAQRLLDAGKDLGPLHPGLFREPPAGFEPCATAPDPVTFHWPGWAPVSPDAPEDKWFREALARHSDPLVEGQTYELVGPAFALNPYGLAEHALWTHGAQVLDVPDRSFVALKALLTDLNAEGLVFHHPDGRMAKIRRKDFGLFWVQADTRRRKPTRQR